MAMVRFVRDPDRPVGMTAEERAFHDDLTEQEIEASAMADPDNPPMSDDELARGVSARRVRQARARTGLSQSQFGARYRINVRRLQDLECGRRKADSALLAYLRVIELEPALVAKALVTEGQDEGR